jgi:cation diffusion facilitator CzcD-associated flavoprotein CzcO
LRRKLRPSFRFGCKRVLISDDYWSTLERENVELVNSGVSEIRSKTIEAENGVERPVDAIVLATGFTVGITTAPIPVMGMDGRSLDSVWSDGACAYKGVAVSGFPNWFILMGPNTGPGHTSVIVYTEAQIGYVLQAIKTMIADDIVWMNVKQDVQDRYNAGLARRMKYTSWTSGCSSWYLSDDGANHSLYPGFASEYCARIRKFKMSDYEVSWAV